MSKRREKTEDVMEMGQRKHLSLYETHTTVGNAKCSPGSLQSLPFVLTKVPHKHHSDPSPVMVVAFQDPPQNRKNGKKK